jgi:hypothetical protein
MICLLCNGGAVRRGESRFESHQQLMQGQERVQRYLWKVDLEASAKDRVELPRRHDRDDARHQLDVDELARCTPLALNATRTPPEERMPAIVDHDILPDMGRMTA